MPLAPSSLARVAAVLAGAALLSGSLAACSSDDDDPAAPDISAVSTDAATDGASPGEPEEGGEGGEPGESPDGAPADGGTAEGAPGGPGGEGAAPPAPGERVCPESVAEIPESQYGPLAYPPESGAPEISQGDFVGKYVAVVEECGVQASVSDEFADARDQMTRAMGGVCDPAGSEQSRAIVGGVLVLARGFDGTDFGALRCDNGTTVVPQMPF